jgi:hypothetical protein
MTEQILQDPKAQEALERTLSLLIRMNETGALAFWRMRWSCSRIPCRI